MAAIASAADGTWIAGATTTWVGGVAPAEGDTATIENTHDVEIDGTIIVGADTTTAAIEVKSGGRLFVPSTVAGNYTLTCKGDIKTDATGGTIQFGTVANPIPNTRTFNLKLNYSASLSDGEFGLLIRAGGTFTCQGSDPWGNGLTDPDRTLLAADAAANATAITVADTTLWAANDRICIAPTTRTSTQHDPTTTFAGQVSSAVGTTLNLTNFGGVGGGLLYAHSGTSPNQAEIINLTRNVVIENYDGGPGAPGNAAYVVFETTATVDVDWTEFRYLGINATDKYGITIKTTSGFCNLNRCSIHDTDYQGVRSGASVNYTMTDCVGANFTHYAIEFASGITLTDIWALTCATGLIPLSGKVTVIDFQWPAMTGVGAAWQATPALLIAADLKYIEWSSVMKDFKMRFDGPGGSTVSFTLPQNWKDQTVVNIGAAWRANDALTLRAGVNLADNPIPNETVNPLFPSTIKNHITAGLGYSFSAVSELNGSLTVAPKVTVTNGQGITIDHRQLNLQLMSTHRF